MRCSLKWVSSLPYITYSMISRYGSEGKERIKTKTFLRELMTEIYSRLEQKRHNLTLLGAHAKNSHHVRVGANFLGKIKVILMPELSAERLKVNLQEHC